MEKREKIIVQLEGLKKWWRGLSCFLIFCKLVPSWNFFLFITWLEIFLFFFHVIISKVFFLLNLSSPQNNLTHSHDMVVWILVYCCEIKRRVFFVTSHQLPNVPSSNDMPCCRLWDLPSWAVADWALDCPSIFFIF